MELCLVKVFFLSGHIFVPGQNVEITFETQMDPVRAPLLRRKEEAGDAAFTMALGICRAQWPQGIRARSWIESLSPGGQVTSGTKSACARKSR